MRLFVDIDDTLITWKEPASGKFITEWEPNSLVIAEVYRWWREAKGDVVFWSTGGADYARQRVQECPITISDTWTYESKYPRIPQPGDVFLDDDPLSSYASVAIHPRALAVTP